MLTKRERKTLLFLSDKMEATAEMVGRHILLGTPRFERGWPSSVGGAVLGRLRKRGFVQNVLELRAWAITSAGREALEISKSTSSHKQALAAAYKAYAKKRQSIYNPSVSDDPACIEAAIYAYLEAMKVVDV